MAQRTFFTLRVHGPAAHASVADRVTYTDVSSLLVVEQVAARMDGAKFGAGRMAEAFPAATSAARVFIAMQNEVRKDNQLVGPFKVQTEHVPADAELIAWWAGTDQGASYHKQAPYGHPRVFNPVPAEALAPMPTIDLPTNLPAKESHEPSRPKKARRAKGA